jgi:hypothetical protein
MNKKLSRRDFLKLAGVTSAGLALSACGITATELPTATFVLPTETAIPTLTPVPTSTPNFENLIKVVNEQIERIAKAYQLSDNQKEILKSSVEKVEVENKPFWFVSSNLIGKKDNNLAIMVGDIPLALQKDYETWDSTGFKDITNLNIGAEFIENENGSDIYMRKNFGFGVISSSWGASTFDNKPVSDFVIINNDGSVVLQSDKLNYSGFEDYQTRQALSHLDGSGRRLMLFHLIYPRRDSMPAGFDQLSREQAISLMTQYIEATVNRYKDRFFAYSVVNEFGMNDDVMMKVIGEDYIDIAFESVRKADATALTILNHHENHLSKAWVINGLDIPKATQKIAQRLKDKGLIDFVGSQCHIDFGAGSPPYIQDEMTSVFKNYPVPVMITELDANTTLYADKPDRFLIQAEKVKGVIQAAIDSGAKYINFWGGFPDDMNWLKLMVNQPNADSTPWAKGWIEKPMYFEALRTLFRNYAKIGVGS